PGRRAQLSRQPTFLPPGSRRLHGRTRTATRSRRYQEPAMKMLKLLPLCIAALFLAACGSRISQSESQMTSFTAGETKADTANLFTLPAEQIAHLQIAPAARGSLPRVLRFTGSVAYNALATPPVFSAAGG